MGITPPECFDGNVTFFASTCQHHCGGKGSRILSASCSHYHKTLVGGLADGGDTNPGVIHTGWRWWEEVAREAGTWLASWEAGGDVSGWV